MVAAVGPRLRAVRLRRGTTLAELSASTGVSVSTLSRLEQGLRRPTLELLLLLARAHQVSLDDLVEAPPTGDPRTTFRPVRRGGMTLVPLTRRAGGLQAFKMVLPGGAPAVLPERQTHEGFEWMYVLSGRLRLLLGEHDAVLVPGEVAEFDTHVPHAFVPAGPEAVEMLVLFGPQGERAHVRARPARRGRPDRGADGGSDGGRAADGGADGHGDGGPGDGAGDSTADGPGATGPADTVGR